MTGRIDQEYQTLKDHSHRWVVERLDEAGIEVGRASRERLNDFIRGQVSQYISQNRVPLSTQDLNQLIRDTLDEVTGFGPLEPLLADERINDILVNGPNQVFVEIAGVLQHARVRFINDEHILRIIRRMLAPLGRRLDEASPMVDARLPDGSRVNAVIPPLALEGPTLSIRKFTGNHLSAKDLIARGSMTEACLDVLVRAVESRRNIIVSGGTGTGKTTMLNLISQYIPREERVLTIEDSAELVLHHPHVVRLETRPANTEGKGRITARDLVINALRMRPDRIILGEVRSGEIIELLQAMNTGHEGSMSTIHANSTRDALVRIETLLAVNGYDASEKAIGRLIGSALDIIIQLVRMPDGRRRVSDVVALAPTADNPYNMDYLYRSEDHEYA
ncbi:CpaF family protein [Alloalcanivorax xenomutans]|uniref:CpaF family protein n=1 Tax=Alloalcanivorax xenomutans TaxID=1094342 RepID=A0A9Q3W4X7_9GAMM|nr:CpaF family protein [Alloalcanivorax xenomutans]ARB44153.1 ATPase [Alloalcanivorax xenomutans]MCE7510635.1 CpaF family protein [Alloalcanivorax xenomutans]WOA31683.1 CpaF family protein [Alloalcanivorax xenomutans]